MYGGTHPSHLVNNSSTSMRILKLLKLFLKMHSLHFYINFPFIHNITYVPEYHRKGKCKDK